MMGILVFCEHFFVPTRTTLVVKLLIDRDGAPLKMSIEGKVCAFEEIRPRAYQYGEC